ncbi:TKL family protein kinase [Tritrichomonas foetus]|uniref:TKL family protein kinase n=1 Tax=Tritrichomonas foetus TaxID=1144522 RepID=A0A1J4KLS8_9EUKA|nr:TKL family protein kinase [Tritrichomonas foetus]|eukprot:OHT10646.1 TKL family protein kinase [Tritrichomonas foetus]
MNTSLKSCLPDLERLLNELEQLASQAAVHKKKFEFAVNQFRRFLVAFSASDCLDSSTPEQNEAIRNLSGCLRELHQILCHHQIQCWAHPTLENPTNTVPSLLTSLAARMKHETEVLDHQASLNFDPDAPQWLQYHLLDLKGIAASFKQYLKRPKPADPVVPLMTERLKSVDSFLKNYENEPVAPFIRVFSPIPINYQTWRVNHSDFIEINEVGSGVSANVFYGTDKRTGNEVAIKKLKFKKLTGGKLMAFQREASILATADHPTLLKFVGATDTPPFCIVTEWMAGGSLYHEIHKYHRMNATKLSICAFDIARGMQFLHSRHIIHRDMKSLNVLLDADGFARICDFGFSRNSDEDEPMTQNIGTPHWMAPELLSATSNYNSKIDVYAYGIVLWEIISHKLPFSGLSPTQIVAQVLMNDIRPAIPENVNQPLRQLITDCWAKDPNDRPTFDEIVRRFVKDRIMLNGADESIFLHYIEDKIGSLYSSQKLESQLEKAKDDTENALVELCDTIERDGFQQQTNVYNQTNDIVSRCWDVVENSVNSAKPSTVGRAASLFLDTPFKSKAASLLRKLPVNSVPQKSMISAIELIPTGSEDFDRDIIVAACKNNAADFAAVYALLPSHVKLALEVVAQHGADVTLRAAVGDRCVQCLGSSDDSLVCAALRCLIGIGETRRVTFPLVKKLIERSEKIRNCAIIVAADIAESGIDVPADIIDTVTNQYRKYHINDCQKEKQIEAENKTDLEKENQNGDGSVDEDQNNQQIDQFASLFLVSACTTPQSAIRIVNRIAFENTFDDETTLKILLASAKHIELYPAVNIALSRNNLESISGKYGEQIAHLAKLVEP